MQKLLFSDLARLIDRHRTRARFTTHLFAEDRDGQDLVEYALLVSVVALLSVTALNGFQQIIGSIWVQVSNSLSGGS